MRIVTILLGLSIAANLQAQAQFSLQPDIPGSAGPSELLGIWGTPKQCAAQREDQFENPSFYPYQISDEWIRHGHIYCYLHWFGEDGSADGLAVHAAAQCGEDTLREYRLVLSLRQQRLRIRWSADFTTRELQRCGTE